MSKPRRRILKDFRIGEISAVDRPVQDGARAVIMKGGCLCLATGDSPAQASTRAALMKRGGFTHIADDDGHTKFTMKDGSELVLFDDGSLFKIEDEDEAGASGRELFHSNLQKAEKEQTMSKEPAFTKADVDTLADKFTQRDPRMSKKTAQAMSVARHMAKAGLYAEAFLSPSQRDTWSREYPSAEVSKGVSDFTKRVADIQSRDKCTKTQAMQKARKEYPEEFAAYQSA